MGNGVLWCTLPRLYAAAEQDEAIAPRHKKQSPIPPARPSWALPTTEAPLSRTRLGGGKCQKKKEGMGNPATGDRDNPRKRVGLGPEGAPNRRTWQAKNMQTSGAVFRPMCSGIFMDQGACLVCAVLGQADALHAADRPDLQGKPVLKGTVYLSLRRWNRRQRCL